MDQISDHLPPMTSHAGDHFPDHLPPSITNNPHPPYAEMIIAAIAALKDKDGSSRQAISKYIEKEFANLPPTHSTLLTHHLKRLKNLGQLVMVKHSYMLADSSSRSGEFVVVPQVSTGYIGFNSGGGGFNLENNNNNSVSGSVKRKPGRPPKLKPVPGLGLGHNQMLQNAQVDNNNNNNNVDVSSYQPRFEYHPGGGQDVGVGYGSGSGFQGVSVGDSEPLFASLGLGDDGVVVEPVPPSSENVNVIVNTPVVVKRGRGRPPKSAGGSGGQVVVSGGGEIQGQVAGSAGGGENQIVERGLGRPGRRVNGVRVKRGRGRPKRVGFGAVTVPLSGNYLRPRGRPKRVVRQKVAVNGGGGGGGAAAAAAGEGVLGSRRRGRPSRNTVADLIGKQSLSKTGPGTAILVTDPQQLVVYQELKSKYEHLQSKVKQVASMVKSCIDPDYGSTALVALQELEDMASEVNASSRGQNHELASSS